MKKKFLKFVSCLLPLTLFIVFFLLPKSAHAGLNLSTDPAFVVLRDNGELHGLWKNFMNIVNGIVVLILIVG
jgi:hypothetical protein